MVISWILPELETRPLISTIGPMEFGFSWRTEYFIILVITIISVVLWFLFDEYLVKRWC